MTQRLDKISFEELLDGSNIDGEIYRCDIKRFFGWDLSEEKVEQIHKSLMEIKCHLLKTSTVGVVN